MGRWESIDRRWEAKADRDWGTADLVTLGAMARRWGVSRAAVYEYVNGKVGSRPAFPEPVPFPFAVDGLEDVRVWSWEDVDSWRRTHVQKSRGGT